MLNKDLFDSPKDLEIAQLRKRIETLEKAINHFKEYDKERNKQLSDALIKIGQLKSYIEELNDTDQMILKLKQLKLKIKEYKKHLSILNKRVFLDRVMRMSDDELYELYDRKTMEFQLSENNKKIKQLTAKNRELIYQLCLLKSHLEKNHSNGYASSVDTSVKDDSPCSNND